MKFNLKSIYRFLFAILTLVLAFTLLIPAQVAFAQDEDPPAEADRQGRWKARISLIYQREIKLLEGQTDRLENTADVVARVEEMIERASEKGLETSGLKEALETYQAGVAEAQSDHDEAAGILRSHAGFDDDGQVTNVEEAIRTVNQARRYLTQAHHLLAKAGRILRLDIRQWIRQQHPKNDQG